ncbi:G-type lectin S-receptor-like serine/threonine-protein kinase [Vitis vinifera]|uniref:non-specific serine/threonine protein kinase n=1 Tax=Vitis vinifera TaxID=29760 RepID=A0A438CNN9_VITVI|nr:G-type lectin S-receptor-like serine/threonine-protein kinase [Vitis vinifera]
MSSSTPLHPPPLLLRGLFRGYPPRCQHHASDLNQTWNSPNSTFSLGFIAATPTSFYAAITYGGVPIWRAGGAYPVAVDFGGSFRFLTSGNLHLVSSNGTVLWESGTAGRGVSSATLSDSGNLVLTNGTVSVWSTFENPTDTIVPTQNFTTSNSLRSGLYSFSLTKSGNLTLTWNSSILYWILAYSSDYAEGSDLLSYNDSTPVCGCPSENFELVDPKDSTKGCKRKEEIENCPGDLTMLELQHAKFLTYSSELSSQVFFVGISACRLNCLVGGSCIASTSLSDGTGLCYLKVPGFVSGYQSPALPSTSYVKVCGPVVRTPLLFPMEMMGRGSCMLLIQGTPALNKGFKEKLGAGGFGAVYRGILANRTIVAVKQLEGIEQGEKQLLVYEFMKNGSLDTCLFPTEGHSGRLLNWENRFSIALGTARGITYLHEECRDCIVHCDIKPENILLDENYNAKVSDFGLAKLINPKDHRYRTLTSVRGTRGYLAPEWLANLPITSKSDVYSYEFEKGNMEGIVDKRLGDQGVDMEQAKRAIQVSFWCIQEQPSQRPMMGKVVQMLEGVTEIERPPAPRLLWKYLLGGTWREPLHPSYTQRLLQACNSSTNTGSEACSGKPEEKLVEMELIELRVFFKKSLSEPQFHTRTPWREANESSISTPLCPPPPPLAFSLATFASAPPSTLPPQRHLDLPNSTFSLRFIPANPPPSPPPSPVPTFPFGGPAAPHPPSSTPEAPFSSLLLATSASSTVREPSSRSPAPPGTASPMQSSRRLR